MMRNFHIKILILAFMAILWPIAGHAINLGDPVSVFVDGAGVPKDQQNPTVIELPDKNLWFVVWEEWPNGNTGVGTGADIWGRFITSQGDGANALCSAPILIYGEPGNQTNPQVAYSQSQNVLLIVWQDSDPGTSPSHYDGFLKGRAFAVPSDPCSSSPSSLSTPVIKFPASDYYRSGGAWHFDSPPSDFEILGRSAPSLAYDPALDKFWVTWVELRSSRKHVYGPAFGGCGSFNWTVGDTSFAGYAALNASDLLNAGTADMDRFYKRPDVIRTTPSSDGSEYYENVRWISSSYACDIEVLTYEYFDNVNNPDIAVDPSSGNVLLTWEGIRRTLKVTNNEKKEFCNQCVDYSSVAEAAADPSDTTVKIHAIFEKNIRWHNLPSLSVSADTGYSPSTIADPVSGRFLVAWESLKSGNNPKIYGQLIYSGGGLYNNNFIIGFQDTNEDGQNDPLVASSRQTNPDVGYDFTNQRFFVAWQDGRNGSVSLENLDIYGQYVDAEGSLRGSNYLLSVSSDNKPAEGSQYAPAIAFNVASHRFLAVWKDARNYANTLSDIYGQRFTIGQPQLTILNADNQLPLSPALLDFGSLVVGEHTTKQFIIKNTGDTTLEIKSLSSLDAPFTYIGLPSKLTNGDGMTLVPSGQIQVNVQFAPTGQNSYHEDLAVNSDSGSVIIRLQGIGISQVPATSSISVTPSNIEFGSVAVGEAAYETLVLQNNGNTDIHPTTPDDPVQPFKRLSTMPSVIHPGESKSIVLKFAPTSGGQYISRAVLLFQETNPVIIELSGNGIESSGPPSISLSSSRLSFPDTPTGSTSAKHLTISNTGTGTAVLLYSTLIGSGFEVATQLRSNLEIKAGETVHAIIEFSPKDVSDHTGTLQLFFAHQISPIEVTLDGKGISEQEYQNSQGQGSNGGGNQAGDTGSEQWADPQTVKPEVVVWQQADGSVHWSFDPNDLQNSKADRYVVLVTPWVDPWTGSLMIYSKNASGSFVPGLVPEAPDWSMRSYTYTVSSVEALVPSNLKGPGQYYLFFGVISPNKIYAAYDWITWIW